MEDRADDVELTLRAFEKANIANDVRKPVNFVQFVDAAKLLGFYWLVMNEPPPPVLANEHGVILG